MASPEDRDKLLAQVKRDIRSLLISAKSGLAIQDLYRDYQSLVFTALPFRRLGFETARSFLQSIPDVCHCQMLPGGDCLVTAVADSSTAHIQKMVERQKPSQKRGATARVLAARHGVRYRPSQAVRTTAYRSQPVPTQTWHRSPAPAAAPFQPQSAAPAPARSMKSEPAAPRQEDEIPSRVAGRLAQVLLTREEGVPAEKLEALYDQAAPDEPLDWAGRGFRNCADMLLRLPHIARIVNSARGLVAYPSRALLAADRNSKAVDSGARPGRQEGASPPGVDPERRPSPTGASSGSPGHGAAANSSHTATSSSGRRQSLLASISETVQTIVRKHPNGLLCSKLLTEYQLQTGKQLAFADLGYHSVLDLVSRLPVRVIKSNAFGDWLLFTPSQPLPDFVNDQTKADDGLMQDTAEDGGRLLQAKERIRDILFSFPDGLRMASLEDHYQMNCNERLPYTSLGFNSMETFVLHLTGDVLQVKYTQDGLKLYPIVPVQPDRAVTNALYPVDAVGPGRSFERVKLPDVPLGEYNLEIFVAEVYHPHKFWFHLVGEEYAEALEKLMDAMELTYCTTLGYKYRMQEATVRVGQVCACPYSEQGYHRAVITGVRPAPEPVKVFYVDYGSVGTVSRDFLRFLPEEFFTLPAQALLGRLANILPPEAEGWSREASKTFLSLVDDNRILYAMVLERSPSCVSLCLCDTNGDTDLHINDRLVELEYAVFRNQSVDIDEKAVEELSRPVSVAPSPSSAATLSALPAVTAAEAPVTAPQPPTASPEVPEGRDTPSDIDRLLQETLGSTGGTATSTPVSPSVPGQPPGFCGMPPLQAAAPGSSAAFTQMLTQSALLNNLQMMQLSLMNPMVNPAYAALLMSQAASRPAFPIGPQTPASVIPAELATSAAPAAVCSSAGTVSAPGTSAVSAAPDNTAVSAASAAAASAAVSAVSAAAAAAVSAATPVSAAGPGISPTPLVGLGVSPAPAASLVVSPAPAASLVVVSPAPAASLVVSPAPAASLGVSPAPVAGTPVSPEVAASCVGRPPAPSVISSGQDAGVCITAPIQASSTASCKGLDEEEIAQMNRELGELAIQRRFIKQIPVPDGTVHLICLDCEGYMVSAEISHFLWTRDILHTMLLMKRVTLPHRSVDVESNQDLFSELVRFNVPGVMDGEELVDPLTLYPITCVPRVFTVFKNMKSEHDVKAIIENIIAEFDPSDPYWTSPDGEDDELAELCSVSEMGGGGGGAPSTVHPAGSTEDPLAGLTPSLAGAVSAELAASPPGADDADLLPEMRAILSQLQNRRRRKVEATMMGLQGTDFSPEDVIGDDLRKLDAQIASFQRRIDALVSEAAGVQPWSRQERRPSGSVRTVSISMNPDAPEFVHPGEESVLAGVDNTLCTQDGEDAASTVPARRRAPVELRAPDGTPIQLSQLVNNAQALHYGTPGSGPPRRPVELRTPDGQPLQLGQSARAVSTPKDSPQKPQTRGSAAGGVPATVEQAAQQQQPMAHPFQIPLPPPATVVQPQPRQQPPSFQQLPQPSLPAQQLPQPSLPAQQPLPSLPAQQQPLPQQMLHGQTLRHQPPQQAPAGPPPAAQPPPPQQQQQQWPRLPAQQPTYGMVYYQPAFPPYQTFMAPPGPYPRLPQPMGYQNHMHPMQAGGYQPAPAPAPYPPPQGTAGPAHPGK